MTSKIKIIYIIPTLDFGGAERLVVDIVKMIDKNKFEVKIICLKRIGEIAKDLITAKIPVLVLKQKIGLDFFLLLELIKVLKIEKPDIIHTHLFGGDVYGIIAARLAGIKKIISTEHNINYFEGRIKRLIKKLVYKLALKIIAVSLAVKNYLLTEGNQENKITVIYNGTDINKFYATKEFVPYSNKKVIIGSVGRLNKQKDFATLISALLLLEIKNWECWIAGDGLRRTKLEKQINNLGLKEKVKLIGWVSDVPQFLRKLDIFVLPSLWEGFGLTVIEAGLAGLPVVASQIDGITEIIDDKENGLLFSPGDSQELASKIEFLLNNADKANRFVNNLQSKIKEKFSLTTMVKQYEKIYLDLMPKK